MRKKGGLSQVCRILKERSDRKTPLLTVIIDTEYCIALVFGIHIAFEMETNRE